MNTASNSHVLVSLRSIHVLHVSVNLSETSFRVALRPVQRKLTEFISARVIRILLELVLFSLFLLAFAKSLRLYSLLGTFLLSSSLFLGFVLCTLLRSSAFTSSSFLLFTSFLCLRDFFITTCGSGLCWRANCPTGADGLVEPADKHEPTERMRVAAHIRRGTVKRSVHLCIFL